MMIYIFLQAIKLHKVFSLSNRGSDFWDRILTAVWSLYEVINNSLLSIFKSIEVISHIIKVIQEQSVWIIFKSDRASLFNFNIRYLTWRCNL